MSLAFKDYFSSTAASYAAFRPHYPAALGELIASHAPQRHRVVECGAGNGQLSQILAGYFSEVVATDASAQQLSLAPAHPSIHYHVANSGALPVADASADAIVVAQAAHWFDLPAFYEEARRIALPDAIIALITYPEAELEGDVGTVFKDFNRNALTPYWPPERELVETAYRTIPFPFDEIPVAPIPMEAAWSFHQLLGYVQTWSAARALEKAGKDLLLQQFANELLQAWGEPQIVRPIRWQLHMRLGRIS